MKICICGDSFLTPDIRYPGAHFSEILASKYNYEVINLARGGMSNIGICFQFEQAIKLQPDIIIYNGTDSSRITIPVGKFIPDNGLKNIRYTDKVSATCNSEYVGGSDAPIVDDVIVSLLNDSCWTTLSDTSKYNISNEQKEAIKQYITYLHDSDLKKTTDGWALGYWQLIAKQYGIRLLEFWEQFLTVSEKNNNSALYVFHTTLKAQIDTAELMNFNLKK